MKQDLGSNMGWAEGGSLIVACTIGYHCCDHGRQEGALRVDYRFKERLEAGARLLRGGPQLRSLDTEKHRKGQQPHLGGDT